jgi:hypothetical protein
MPLPVAGDPDHRMEHRANGGAKVMEIFEQAVDDERGIGGHRLDYREHVVVVTGDGLDSRDHGLGAVGKELEGRLHQRQLPLGRDALAIVGGLAREQPRGKGGDLRRGIGGKISVD